MLLSNIPGCLGYQPPTLGTPREVLSYMIAQQTKYFGENIYTKVPHAALLKHIKEMTEEYTYEEIGEGVDWAIQLADHPFSTKFLRGVLEACQQELNLPSLNAYFQNKS